MTGRAVAISTAFVREIREKIRFVFFSPILGWAASTHRLLRLRPFNTSSPEGRSDERHRRIILSATASVLAKGLSITAGLISVPLTLKFLGAERYGVWMTISSFVAILAFADLGIGNGLLNAISRAHGRNDRREIRQYVASSFFLLGIVCIAIMLAFSAAYAFVPWYAIFNVKSLQARNEAGPALAAFTVCFALSIPAGIIQRIQMGLQQSFAASLWQCVASLFSLVAVLLAIWFKASLPLLVMALMGAPLLANLINAITFFVWFEPDIAPGFRYFSGAAASYVANMGFLFFVLQIVGTLAYASDNLIVAQLYGAAAVAQYAVADKMFSVIPILASMVIMPLWPAYGEAATRGDYPWIWGTLKRSVAISTSLTLFGSLILVLAGPSLVRLWVGHVIGVPFALLLSLGVWKVFQTAGSALSAFLNGMHVVRFQVITSLVGGIFSILLKIYWVKSFGVVAVPWASTCAYVLFGGIPIVFYISRMKAKQRNSEAMASGLSG
jgi:O-antigen/teichoic acid export membrane protein